MKAFLGWARVAILAILGVVVLGCGGDDGGEPVPADSGTEPDSGGGMDSGDGCEDADGDGHADARCGGDDCDDGNPDRYPGNRETCDSAGIDEDCNPTTFAAPGEGDADGDGFVSATCCNMVGGGSTCGPDCDDGNASIRPGASDGCGGGDENCDGVPDDNPDDTFYRDADGDGYGAATETVTSCSAPEGYVAAAGDCDDTDAAINPAGTEACEGSVDENCSGTVDEGCPCTVGEVDESCGPTDETGACRFGARECGEDGTWGTCVGAVMPTVEQCNGGSAEQDDEDCDGTIDEADACECTNGSTRACRDSGASAFGSPSICNEVVQVCSDGSWPRPCAEESLTGPTAETCDGSLDEDCDGTVDEGCGCTDGELRRCSGNLGECTAGSQTCSGGSWSTCSGNLPSDETCNHLDDDCDGTPDDGVNVSCTWTASTLLSEELVCLPGVNCNAWTLDRDPNPLILGWTGRWSPGDGNQEARVAYVDEPVDWGRLGFAVEAVVRARRNGMSTGQAKIGVLLTPRNVLGYEVNHGLPRLSPGQSGWAALYDTQARTVSLYELRPGESPLYRDSSPALPSCDLEVWSTRAYRVELRYEPGLVKATVQGEGCGSQGVTVELTSSETRTLYGFTESYPKYYPGVVGDDVSGGVHMYLDRLIVVQSWSCDGCPW